SHRLTFVATSGDLREWIALLEREGELVRISAEVDPYLEVTEIVDRTVRAGGPALLFENLTGSPHPLLINQFGTERRMCLALGVDHLDDAAAKLGSVLEMQPPEGLVDKVRGLKKLKSIADSRPKTVSRAAHHEVALGLDPVSAYSASAPLPKHIDEFMLAGFLKGEPVELVPGKTVGVEVPANAEIVLEGYVEQGDLTLEGPFGDHTGYYSHAEQF